MLPELFYESIEDYGVVANDYVLELVASGQSNKVCKLIDRFHPNQPTFYLKEYPSDLEDMNIALREVTAIDILRKANIPVPESRVITLPLTGATYLMQKEIPGTTLTHLMEIIPNDQISGLIKKSAELLVSIHQITSNCYGSIIASDGQQFLTWEECFKTNIHRMLSKMLDNKILDDQQALFFINKTSLISNAGIPAFTHGDYWPGNIIFDPNNLTVSGLIDFEFSAFRCPEWELTKIATDPLQDNPENLKMFFNHYAFLTGNPITGIMDKIELYRPFESLEYWFWGWGRSPELNDAIIKDVKRVFGNL